jgi:hypothetical protein
MDINILFNLTIQHLTLSDINSMLSIIGHVIRIAVTLLSCYYKWHEKRK